MRKAIIGVLIFLMLAIPVNAGTLTKKGGVNLYNGQKETWYNLKMDKVIQKASERLWVNAYWVRDDGVKMFGGYVIVAAPFDVHPWGSLVNTSLGTGIVLDTGLFAETNKDQVDIATNW